jgi:predicted O-methyltransferase YrrM
MESSAMSVANRIRTFLKTTKTGSVLAAPYRFKLAAGYHVPQLLRAASWSLQSREFTNFTYDLTRSNIDYLAHTIATVTGSDYDRVRRYMNELDTDAAAKTHVIERTRSGPEKHYADARCSFGRRLGWYAIVRIMKPKVVVETGVDKGLGSVALCAALLRNSQEGFPGNYFGTDINPAAGFLLDGPYREVGRILYGDSIESLRNLKSIDLFISDSDHSADYEGREYETIAPKLTPGALILGDNAHITSELSKFSANHGRRFLFFKEQPENHWYPGGGIGISYETAGCVARATTAD